MRPVRNNSEYLRRYYFLVYSNRVPRKYAILKLFELFPLNFIIIQFDSSLDF